MIYADTSFLFALYQRADAFYIATDKLMARLQQPLALTLLGELELLNNVHRALASKNVNQAEHDAMLRQIAADEADGVLIRRTLADADLYARARAIARKFSIETNSRSLDILHVAAAELLRVTSFVSFDAKQRLLAHKVGLHVLPRTLSAK